VLLGPGETRRALGAAALVGGGILAWLLRRYIQRPVDDPTARGGGTGALVWTVLAVAAPIAGAEIALLSGR
jgi:hypothetical protein